MINTEYEINDFLISRLKKDFPGFRLRPHTKLFFLDQNIGLLYNGKMKISVRYEKGTLRYPSSNRIPIYETNLETDQRKDLGMIKINKMVVKKFDELDDNDASLSGLYAVEKLRQSLKKIFGPIGKSEYISIYYLEQNKE